MTQKHNRLPSCPTLLKVATICIAAAPILTNNAKAVAYRAPNQDPEAMARGNAFTATADNPSAIYYNPAGITQLEGHNLSVGSLFISLGFEYESAFGATAKSDTTLQTVPQLYYVYSPEESPLSFGLGIYAPYGLAIDWGRNTPFRTMAQEGQILYASINPVVAYQVHPTLSVAIGPTINYSKAVLKQGIGIVPNDEFRFEGDGFDYGFNAGLLWQPHEKWSFGLNYRFATEVNYKGDSEARPFFAPQSSSGSLRFPQYVMTGVSFRPTEKWNFEFNIDWTDWDNVNEALFRGTSFGDVPFPMNYRSSFMYEFGVTYQLPKNFFVSAGYFFSESSIPEQSFNPLVPDADLHLGSIGFGRKGERWNWAFATHIAYNGGTDISNGTLADGRYKTFNPAFSVSATLKF